MRMSHHRIPLLARAAGTHPLGKLVALPHVRVSDPTRDALQKLAAEAGVPVSEFVRVMVEERVHGGHVARVAAARQARIVGIGTASGPMLRMFAGE